MSRTPPTRMALLERRAALATATCGVEILRAKRDALLRELYQAAGKALEFRTRAAELASRAATALARAEGAEGAPALTSLARATERDVLVDIDVRNVWGVRVPRIMSVPTVRRASDRGYGLLATSASVDDAAETHEKLVDFVLAQAPEEIRLRRLASELRRTARKVATLERRVMPRLRAEAERIESSLEELAREDRFRLELLRQGP